MKYLLDTCVFNWLVDKKINEEDLNKLIGNGVAIVTHIQIDEINNTSDQERRARLSLVQASLIKGVIPTETTVLDIARLGYSNLGNGILYSKIKMDLDQIRSKENNIQDALIAETSIKNGYILITADANLSIVTQKHGGQIHYYSSKP